MTAARRRLARLQRHTRDLVRGSARVVGILLTLASLAFVVHAAVKYHVLAALLSLDVSTVVVGVILYTVAVASLSLAWIALVAKGGPSRAAVRQLQWAYACSVLTKYIPGNVFHFVSRHADLSGMGYSHAEIAAANLREVYSQVTAAVLVLAVAVVGFGLLGEQSTVFAVSPLASGALLVVAAVVLGGAGVWKGWLRGSPFVLHVIFLLIFEAVGYLAFASLTPAAAHDYRFGTFAAAWLLGYVVIGSPGGVGVREWAIITLMHGAAPAATLVATSVALRAITTVAEVLFTSASFVAHHATRAPGPDEDAA